MFLKKMMLAALWVALTTSAAHAGFSSENALDHFDDSEKFNLDDMSSNQISDSHFWGSQNVPDMTFTAKRFLDFAGSGFSEGSEGSEEVSNPISYNDFDGYHRGINFWWMEDASPAEGYGNNRNDKKFKYKKRFKRILYKKIIKRLKQRHRDKIDPATQVPVPAAFLLFASALGMLGIRKNLKR